LGINCRLWQSTRGAIPVCPNCRKRVSEKRPIINNHFTLLANLLQNPEIEQAYFTKLLVAGDLSAFEAVSGSVWKVTGPPQQAVKFGCSRLASHGEFACSLFTFPFLEACGFSFE
jgi:hypothetical protein